MVAQSLESRLTPLERSVSRLEGGYEHVATKADLADVKTDIATLAARGATAAMDHRHRLHGDCRVAHPFLGLKYAAQYALKPSVPLWQRTFVGFVSLWLFRHYLL